MAWRGERATFERLVDECLPRALRFALSLTGDVDAADEVVQEAMLRASSGWRSFRGEAQFRTWLFRIVINCFRDRLVRRRGAGPLPDDLDDPRCVAPTEAAEANELGQIIARQVSQLPPRQREVLLLTCYEGLAASEIARVLGIGEANVHATLHVARRRLRRQLAPYMAES
jgi:RNA polymerase sigma-70 factor (ECF subfamily)